MTTVLWSPQMVASGMPSPGQSYGQSLLPPGGGAYQAPPQNGMLAPRPGQPPPGQQLYAGMRPPAAMQGLPGAATPPPYAASGAFQAPQVRGRHSFVVTSCAHCQPTFAE